MPQKKPNTSFDLTKPDAVGRYNNHEDKINAGFKWALRIFGIALVVILLVGAGFWFYNQSKTAQERRVVGVTESIKNMTGENATFQLHTLQQNASLVWSNQSNAQIVHRADIDEGFPTSTVGTIWSDNIDEFTQMWKFKNDPKRYYLITFGKDAKHTVYQAVVLNDSKNLQGYFKQYYKKVFDVVRMMKSQDSTGKIDPAQISRARKNLQTWRLKQPAKTEIERHYILGDD